LNQEGTGRRTTGVSKLPAWTLKGKTKRKKSKTTKMATKQRVQRERNTADGKERK